MARARTYNHSRFDGGMTHNRRDTQDLTKLGLISHLDIYRDKNKMHVMPGYVADMAFGGNPTGLKTFDVQNFINIGGTTTIYALGKKSSGTGSKLIQRVITESEWKVPTQDAYAVEGSADLIDYPFVFYANAEFHYPVKSGGSTTVARHGPNVSGNYNATWQSWLSYQPIGRTYRVGGFTGETYLTKGLDATGISSITASAVTVTAKPTAAVPTHIVSGDYQMGIVGTFLNPRRSQTLMWDAASLLADQNIQLGKGHAMVIGYPSGLWAVVSTSAVAPLESNGKDEMSVRIIQGETPDTLYKLDAVSPIDSITGIFALNDTYQDSMLWYGRVEVAPSEFRQGIWALGKGEVTGQFGVSLLLDTTSLNLVRNACMFGYSMYFIHNNDGSVSRLGDYQTGAFDVPATIETLIYGADSPYQKELKGISIVTEDLPSGGSVVCSYRTDENSAWTPMGTSNTAGTRRHSFTKAEGVPIGKFQEIQFKFVITGKVTVKNIRVDTIETDNLPY